MRRQKRGGDCSMSENAFEKATRLISSAKTPGDLFPPDRDEAVKVYRRLARLVHPDVHPSDGDDAPYAALSALWSDYGKPPPEVIHGDVADLFPVAEGFMKMPRLATDNDLMEREARALKRLHSEGESRYRDFIPELVSTARMRDPATGITRRANTLRRLDGFYSLEEVRQAYPAGLHPRDIAWIWRRVLTAIGFAHSVGIIHGAVLPPHVMIQPETHGLVLADWCYSAQGDSAASRIPAMVSRYQQDRMSGDYYPPEVSDKEPPSPATDIYMAARTMEYLMWKMGAGSWTAADNATKALSSFARGCTLAIPGRRPQNAWALIAELDDLLERLFGPPRYHVFTMPE